MRTKLSNSGEVVLPVSVREALDLHPGDEFEVTSAGSVITLRPVDVGRTPATGDIDAFLATLPRLAEPVEITSDLIDEAIEREARRRNDGQSGR